MKTPEERIEQLEEVVGILISRAKGRFGPPSEDLKLDAARREFLKLDSARIGYTAEEAEAPS